jgi:hypothetical protein
MVIHNHEDLGFTGSLLKAFQHVRYSWVVYNAVDYPFDLVRSRQDDPVTY